MCDKKNNRLNKKVYIVLVTYNGAAWIDENLCSLQQSGYPVQVIAVDNASADSTVALLGRYDGIDVILSPENLGFGKANNIGIKKALAQGADYIFLLNQDAWVFTDTIGSLIQKMENNPALGILSPMHYNADELTLDAGFTTYYSRKTGYTDKDIAKVPFVNAAAWMLSRACIEKIGFFEPLFGHYGEDRNYCDRVTYHKFLIGIDETSKVVHDRVIIRNFKKDVIQSRYKLLTTILNINFTMGKAYMLALKEVIGLPKYFAKYYSLNKVLQLFINLAQYYFVLIFKYKTIAAARRVHKQ